MDMARFWVSYLELCQAFTATTFSCCLGSLSICFQYLISFVAFGWLWAEYSPIRLRITSVSSDIISELTWALSIGSYTCPLHNKSSAMFDTWCSMLWLLSSSLSSPNFSCFHHSDAISFVQLRKLSVFTFMKSSLDCIFLLRYTYLPQSILDLSSARDIMSTVTVLGAYV